MDELTRLHYLQAMGIDVWLSRQQGSEQCSVMQEIVDTPLTEDGSSEQHMEMVLDGKQAHANIGFHASHTPAWEVIAQHSDVAERKNVQDSIPMLERSNDLNTGTDSWGALQQEVKACQACSLCQTRTQTVFGVGKRNADWLLIGEAPGQSEDQQGEPFVGKAGQLLNEMLLAIGMQREDVYIANMLKCRPPNNRDPHVDEIEACRLFLQRQITLIQPKVILAVGRIAAQNLLNQTIALSKLRGRQHQLLGVPLYVVHHPAYLLRSPLEKRKAWEDLQFAVAGYQRLVLDVKSA